MPNGSMCSLGDAAASVLQDPGNEGALDTSAQNPEAHQRTGEPPPRKSGQFSRLPAAAVFDRNVTNGNLRVLAALGTYVDPEGYCFPAVGTIAKALGVKRQAIQNHLRCLRAAGYVE